MNSELIKTCAIFFLSLSPIAVKSQQAAPDVILLNGKIFSSDAAHPYVQALAIRGEQITATGRSGTKLLNTDPLTGLPLYPATDSRLHLGNEPTRLPESNVCKSKMQADFYSVYDSKVDITITWYASNLPGFKRTHGYAANRSQDTFYNANGTIAVSVTGSARKEGENTDAYSVVYARFQPGLTEKTLISLNQKKVVCR